MTDHDQLNLQPVLQGATISLRPLLKEDFDALYAVARDPLIWEQHPDPTRWQRPVFEKFFTAALDSLGALAIIDNKSGKMIGSSRYYELDPAKREVAIGYTFIARSHWGGNTNRELKTLMLDHALHWATRVWFHIGRDNWRSRKAMEKIGGVYSHEEPRMANGVLHPHGYYWISRQGASE